MPNHQPRSIQDDSILQTKRDIGPPTISTIWAGKKDLWGLLHEHSFLIHWHFIIRTWRKWQIVMHSMKSWPLGPCLGISYLKQLMTRAHQLPAVEAQTYNHLSLLVSNEYYQILYGHNQEQLTEDYDTWMQWGQLGHLLPPECPKTWWFEGDPLLCRQ